jgi:AcrR family transcriptional regulator
MTYERKAPKDRKQEILDAAIDVAERDGYHQLNRGNIALKAGVSRALINNYFGTLKQLQRAVMRRAIKDGNHRIVAAGLAINDPVALKASPEVKQAALLNALG